eukprot:gene507-biopygen4334
MAIADGHVIHPRGHPPLAGDCLNVGKIKVKIIERMVCVERIGEEGAVLNQALAEDVEGAAEGGDVAEAGGEARLRLLSQRTHDNRIKHCGTMNNHKKRPQQQDNTNSNDNNNNANRNANDNGNTDDNDYDKGNDNGNGDIHNNATTTTTTTPATRTLTTTQTTAATAETGASFGAPPRVSCPLPSRDRAGDGGWGSPNGAIVDSLSACVSGCRPPGKRQSPDACPQRSGNVPAPTSAAPEDDKEDEHADGDSD